MIREVRREEIPACATLIKKSFMTVADEYGITEEGALNAKDMLPKTLYLDQVLINQFIQLIH